MAALVNATINVQNCSSNCGPDAALEDALDGGLMLNLNEHVRVLFKSN